MKFVFSFFLVLMCAALWAAAEPAAPNDSPATSCERKFAHIQANGRSAHPGQSPTLVSEQEINAYLASPEIELPAGVESVKLQGQPGIIDGTARIDFDKVRAGVHSSNPLLAIFSGVHEVVVDTHAHGAGRQGYVHVDSVSIDGIEVPRFALQLFVEKYLQPKYPEIGLDSRFTLPDRIDTATVGEHQVTITQK